CKHRLVARAWHHRGMTPAEPRSSRMTSFSQDDRGLRAAVAYSLAGKRLDARARELQASRASGCRLLARARAPGAVEITALTPGAQASCLSTALRARHGVETLVVPLPKESSVEERHARTAEAAAEVLRQVVTSDAVLAVAWGTMTQAISLHLRPKGVT